jgi:hypothetical protein
MPEPVEKPVSIGPRKPEVENVSASKLKFLTRCAGGPSVPIAWLTAMWNSINPEPTSGLAINSTSSRGTANTSANPAIVAVAPSSIGLRTPMRSMIRPALTNVIGTNAINDTMTPTVNGDACKLSANNDRLTRNPANAKCSRMVGTTTR